MPNYLVWYGHNNSYFSHRFRELESLAKMHGIPVSDLYLGVQPTTLSLDPYAIISLPDADKVAQVCERSVLIKFVIELWGKGETDEQVISDVLSTVSREKWDSVFAAGGFSYKVLAYGAQYTERARQDRMAAFSSLFSGKERVDLKTPSVVLHVIDVFGHFSKQTGTRNESEVANRQISFYGRQVFSALLDKRQKFVLTERPILGPTSLDNDLAFLMANMAEISPGDFVLDPFCGTGGLLVTAAALCGGLFGVGTDIDTRVLKGDLVAYVRNAVEPDMGKDIFQNFKHYGLPVPEIVASDNAQPPWRKESILFDVILTDPPYGVRAGAKKIGAKFVHEIGQRDSYYPQMVGYKADEVNADLLARAADLLVDNGRLVFLQHCELIDLFTQEELENLRTASNLSEKATKIRTFANSGAEYVYANECARDLPFLDEAKIAARVIPKHPNLELESAVLQILSAGTGRILVKMRRLVRC